MDIKETVFVTQKFDGKEIKNIYHVEVSPETYKEAGKTEKRIKLKNS